MWLVILVLLITVCLLHLDSVKPKNFPPGPRWLPVVGCAHIVYGLWKQTGYLCRAVEQLSAAVGDASVLGLRIGKDRIVIVNSFQANKEMLHNEDINGRPKGIFYETRTWGKRRGILFTDGEQWKEHRRFLLKHLKGFGLGRRGMEVITEVEAYHMVTDLKAAISRSGSPVVLLHSFFGVYVLNTLWQMMAGVRYEAGTPKILHLQTLLTDLFKEINMTGATFSYFPILAILAPGASGYRTFMGTHRKIWKFLREELDRHKENFDPEKENKDYMDAFIRVMREKGEADSYSEEQLMAMCLDMFIAGSETTNKSLSFGFSNLVREQEVQRKAQDEIDRVVGRKRFPRMEDRLKMPYTEAVVFESIRHFVGRGLGIPHRALRNTTLDGYFIPEDTMVVSNFSSILMDERLFPNPLAFSPERFLVAGRVVLPAAYFPFGLAKHRCMGEVLARCNVFLFTATMLQRFTFLPVDGEAPPPHHTDGVTPAPAPYKALVVPRF